MTTTSSIFDRMKIFEHPFAYIVMNTQVNSYCSHCMRPPDQLNNAAKLQKCARCGFAKYCSKDCQRLAWRVHKSECARLARVYPNLPLTEVLFLSRICDRVEFMATHGDRFDWQRERRWSDLLGHEAEIRADTEKFAHFEKMYAKFCAFRTENDKSGQLDRDTFFTIFCRTAVNSHSIHTNAGIEIGMALDLGVSKYNHSCRPNCTLVFDGYRAFLRPLTPEIDAADYRTACISYVDVGRSRWQRRRDLASRWYFHCECERCVDPDDDILTSIRCANTDCDNPLIITEETEPIDIICKKCGTLNDSDTVLKARDMMRSLPSRFVFDKNVEQSDAIRQLLTDVTKRLHAKNIYLCRLQTAYMHLMGTLGENLLQQPEIQRQVYENYKQCFPRADRHIGYQLLHLVKSLIEAGKRNEATAYAYEAMSIFEICFGLQHPYYLQTLALWTFLDTKAAKSDDQLIALMNFNYNRPVNISPYLQRLDAAATTPPAIMPVG